MADLLKVSWSAEAIQNLSDINEYLRLKWTENEVRNFFQKLDRCIHLISSNPKLFPVTKHRKDLRRCVLSKQTSIYYFFNESEIFIVSLFDNRRKNNPD